MQHDMQHASCNATCLRSCLLLSIIMHAVHNIIADREHEHVNANCDRLRCLSINMHAVHNIIADREHEHVNANCDRLRCLSMRNMPKKGLFCQRRPTIGKPPKTPFLGGFPRTPEIPPSRARGGNPGNPGFSPGASWGEKVPKNDPKNGPFFDPFFLGNPALRPLFLGGISGAPKIRPQKCPKNAQKKGYLITLPFGTLFWVFSRGGFWGVFGGFRGIPPKSGFLGVRYRGYPTTFQRHVTQHATTYNMQCNMYATCNATCS